MFLRKLAIAAILCAGVLVISSPRAEEAITKEQVQTIFNELAKLKAENTDIKAQNAQLQTQVTKLNDQLQKQAAATKSGAIPSNIEQALDDFLAKDEFKPYKTKIDYMNPGTTKFLMTGSASTDFVAVAHQPSTFTTEFDPIFLWKLSERLSFEAETPIVALDGIPGSAAASIELEYANIAYVVNDYLTIQAGKMKDIFGLFNPRYDPKWINKFVDAPMVYDDGGAGLVPHQQTGVQGIGAVDLGPTKLRYAAFISNGMHVEPADPATFGELIPNDVDNNNNKGFGGRVGFLPIPSLELGFSIEYSGNVFDAGLPHAMGRILGADLSSIHEYDWLKGTLDLKAEWAWSAVGKATYQLNEPDGVTPVVFNNNRRNGGYFSLAYRPTKIDQKWVKNLEATVRWDHLSLPSMTADTPLDARFQRESHDRWTIGLNYWLTGSTVLKANYEHDSHSPRTFTLEYAIGF
ncbi:MAG TPA: hypothetical protein VGP72_17835 [Planctomycetota bacterium]|jgi:hypothetical protein